MLSAKASRWVGLLILLMLGLRLGYKYYRSQQPSLAEVYMSQAEARKQALVQAIQADQEAQRANGATVVVADSAVLAADTGNTVQ
jgi:cytochrome b